jgi:hypothetical protein
VGRRPWRIHGNARKMMARSIIAALLPLLLGAKVAVRVSGFHSYFSFHPYTDDIGNHAERAASKNAARNELTPQQALGIAESSKLR